MKATVKKATIVAMAAIAATNVSEETKAMQCAFADMAQEYGQECIIIEMNPFEGFCA